MSEGFGIDRMSDEKIINICVPSIICGRKYTTDN